MEAKDKTALIIIIFFLFSFNCLLINTKIIRSFGRNVLYKLSLILNSQCTVHGYLIQNMTKCNLFELNEFNIKYIYLLINYVVKMADTTLAVRFSSKKDVQMKIVE